MRPLSLSVKKQWLMVKDSGRRSVGEVNRVHIPLLKIYFLLEAKNVETSFGQEKRRKLSGSQDIFYFKIVTVFFCNAIKKNNRISLKVK